MLLGLVLDPEGERLALFRGRPANPGHRLAVPETEGTVGMLVLDLDGRILKEIPAISPLARCTGSGKPCRLHTDRDQR